LRREPAPPPSSPTPRITHGWWLDTLASESDPYRAAALPTRELLRLVYEHQIGYVMVDGIAHVPEDAIDEYRARAS
jgi:hypothetical protein